ncbi:MAG TPA: hypothetical protein VFA33_07610 [Bryobacteraceae bacterium]|nr:hypothetical protein [Bryobacteraceae bacterium]
MIPSVQNLFINKVLEHILDGNKGSNILTAILTAVLGARINWAQACRGFRCDNAEDAAEAAKLVGVLVLAVFGYYVGKKTPAAPPQA